MSEVSVPKMFDATVSVEGLLADKRTSRCEITELAESECACRLHRNSVDDWTPQTRHVNSR